MGRKINRRKNKKLVASGACLSYIPNDATGRPILVNNSKNIAHPDQIWYKALLSATYASKREIEMLGFTGFS